MIQSDLDKLNDYISQEHYTEHNPDIGDDLTHFKSLLSNSHTGRLASTMYKKCHLILAEGNFVLSVCEGYTKQEHYSFFDLYRVKDRKIVEHWDTKEAIPPRNEWKNNNGKF